MKSGIIEKDRTVQVLDLTAQYRSIEVEIKTAIERVLTSQHFILGPEGKALENEIAHYCGKRFGVGVASGTDALILALCACGVGPGDEVIVPSFTFIATADSVSILGAKPVFVDIDPDTFCVDPLQIAEKITSRTKAVIPVHLYGQPAEMDGILDVAAHHKLKVVEDNAQALGGVYKGKKTASLGDVGCISFFPSKNLGAYGDGGMVVTDSEDIAGRLQSLRAHGTSRKYFSVEQGWNSRLDELQAAILRAKLPHLDDWTWIRRSRASLYSRLLRDVPEVKCPIEAECTTHVFHQYTIEVENRDKVQQTLAAQGIGSTVYYPVPIHLQPIYQSLGYRQGDLPVTERAAKRVLSLPIYPELHDDQIECVVDVLRDAVKC